MNPIGIEVVGGVDGTGNFSSDRIAHIGDDEEEEEEESDGEEEEEEKYDYDDIRGNGAPS